jgi:hypothetical protein
VSAIALLVPVNMASASVDETTSASIRFARMFPPQDVLCHANNWA